ncbi:hypothetical protein D3C75_1232480 [compost metagenome]
MLVLPQPLSNFTVLRLLFLADVRQPGAAEQKGNQQYQHGDRHIGHLHRALVTAACPLGGGEKQRAADHRADKLP